MLRSVISGPDQRSANMREIISDVECKMMNELQARIGIVISDVRTEAGKRSVDIAKMYQATRETCDKFNDVECNLRSEMLDMQEIVEARADRLIEVENQLSSLRVELSTVKTVPAVDKVSLAPADTECMMYDDNTASRDLGVQAPRNRAPSRSGMPRSAFVVEGGHGDVMVGGGDRFETAGSASSRHTVPIGQSAAVSEHDIHQTQHSTYPTSTQPPPPTGERGLGYAHTTQTANREISARDEPSYESSLQMGAKDIGVNARVPPTRDLRGSSAGLPVPAPSESSERAANTTQLSLRDSSGGKVPHVHADVSLPDGAY